MGVSPLTVAPSLLPLPNCKEENVQVNSYTQEGTLQVVVKEHFLKHEKRDH